MCDECELESFKSAWSQLPTLFQVCSQVLDDDFDVLHVDVVQLDQVPASRAVELHDASCGH
jgi:hypothetical protein